MDTLADLIKTYRLPSDIKIIAGGETRAKSVKNAFDHLCNVDTVLIHDGARPNISETLIKQLIAASAHYSVVIPGIPAIDTIKIADSHGFVKETPNRNQLFHIQTPQVFHYLTLKKAYANTFHLSATDEAAILEAQGIPIKIIEGDRMNIKITFPEDFKHLT